MNTITMSIEPALTESGSTVTDSFLITRVEKVVVSLDDVRRVYSGKRGKCMCGCAGKYSRAKRWQREESENRGYPVEDNECSDREVKRIVALLLMHPNTKVDTGLSDEMHMYVEQGERIYCAYFVPGSAEAAMADAGELDTFHRLGSGESP